MKSILMYLTIMTVSLLAACAPEVGSERWCNKMDETVKGEWSANDVKEYASNCVFRKQK